MARDGRRNKENNTQSQWSKEPNWKTASRWEGSLQGPLENQTWSGLCFLNLNVHLTHLEDLLKYEFLRSPQDVLIQQMWVESDNLHF